MNGEFRALSLGSLAVILVALGIWAAFFGPEDEDIDATPATSAFVIDAVGPVLVRGVPESGGMDAGMGGTLTLDGACLHFGDGYAIVWPGGTTWDGDSREVVLRNGERVPVGSNVWGGGGAGGIHEMTSPAARALLENCLSDLSDEAEQVIWLNDRPEELAVD